VNDTRRMPTRSRWTGCWPRRIMESEWPCMAGCGAICRYGGLSWGIETTSFLSGLRGDSFNKTAFRYVHDRAAWRGLPAQSTTEQLIATAFNRMNMMTAREARRRRNTSPRAQADRGGPLQAFLGSTMGCCECHDHKFDPFKQGFLFDGSVLRGCAAVGDLRIILSPNQD